MTASFEPTTRRARLDEPGAIPTRVRERGHGHPDHLIGYSPLGALSVFAVLGLLPIQVATGLVADDEIGNGAPSRDDVASRFLALAVFAVCAAFAVWIASLRV